MGALGRLGINQRIRGVGLGLAMPRRPWKRTAADGPPTRVLAIRPDHLGDLLLTTPALRLLRSTLPEAQITLLAGTWNAEAAHHLPAVNEVLTLDFPWFDRRPRGLPWEPYGLLRREAARLRGLHFDAAIILRHDFWFGAALAAAAEIPCRVGYDLPETRQFLTNAVPFPGERHEVRQAFELVGAAFAPANRGAPGPAEFETTGEERAAASRWLREHEAGRPLVAVHPGAGAAVKLWRAERFGELVRALHDRHGAAVVLTGGLGERPLVEQIAAHSGGQALALLGAPLGKLAAVLQHCSLAIGVDSGIMHLAAAVGAPTVRLFGPVSSARFGPWGEPERHRVIRADLPCVPCERLDFPPDELPFHPCVRSIRVEQVVDAASSLLPAGSGAR